MSESTNTLALCGSSITITYPTYLDLTFLLRLPLTKEASPIKIPLTQWYI